MRAIRKRHASRRAFWVRKRASGRQGAGQDARGQTGDGNGISGIQRSMDCGWQHEMDMTQPGTSQGSRMTIGCIKPTFTPPTPSWRPGERFIEQGSSEAGHFGHHVGSRAGSQQGSGRLGGTWRHLESAVWPSAASLRASITAARPAMRGVHLDNNRLLCKILLDDACMT
jgi:hypothetical protein